MDPLRHVESNTSTEGQLAQIRAAANGEKDRRHLLIAAQLGERAREPCTSGQVTVRHQKERMFQRFLTTSDRDI